jgi:trigger factor
MKSEVVDLGPCRKRLSIELEAEKVREEYDSVCKELEREAELPGFRKGRVPRNLLVSKFGRQITADAKAKLVERSFHEAVEEKKLEVVGEPDLDAEKIEFDVEKPLSFQCEVEVKPVFDLPEVEGLKLERPSEEVTDADVEEVVRRMCRRFAEFHPEAGPAQVEDVVIVDARLEVEGKEVWKDGEVNAAITEDGVVGLPFGLKTDDLAGVKAGDRRTADVELPMTFHAREYAGKPGRAELSVKDVKRPQVPELTDELAKRFGAAGAEAFRADVRTRIAERKKSDAESALREQVTDQLIAATKFELPGKLLERAAARGEVRRRYQLERMGLAGDALSADARAELASVSRREAERDLRAYLILERLAKARGIEVSDAEVETFLKALAVRRGTDPAALHRHLEETGELEMIRVELAEQKVVKAIIEKAVISEAKAGDKPAKAKPKAGKE